MGNANKTCTEKSFFCRTAFVVQGKPYGVAPDVLRLKGIVMENIKFIFDKRKLDTLIRLGVPDSALLELLKTGVAPKTGDALIDDYLKSVLSIKKFKNTWGGKRDGSGKKQRNSNTKAFHLEKQLEKQLDCQVVDIDIDIDKDNISLENKGGIGGKENLSKKRGKMCITHLEDMNNLSCSDVVDSAFNDFWRVYPKDRAGNKAKAFQAYKKALKEGRASSCDEINQAAEVYARSDEVKRGFAKGAAAWLNDDRFKSKYKTEDGKGLDGLTDFQRDVINSMNW